jgi:hypothetical protein
LKTVEAIAFFSFAILCAPEIAHHFHLLVLLALLSLTSGVFPLNFPIASRWPFELIN